MLTKWRRTEIIHLFELLGAAGKVTRKNKLVDDEDYDDYDDDDYVDEFDDENFVKSNEAKNEQPRKLPERRKVRKYLYKWQGTTTLTITTLAYWGRRIVPCITQQNSHLL